MEKMYRLEQIPLVAKELLDAYGDYPVWVFHAPMGAGKTTLVSTICKAMGVEDQVSSPTFSLMNEYQVGNKLIVHMDWYRIEGEEEATRAGLAAAIDEADYCFIEWPEKAPGIVPENALHLQIEILDPITRKIIVQ
jgi:tRNA threonylcarbamoyladenosine biosynthesis protein TsaE